MMVAGSLNVYEPYVCDFWSGFRLRRSMNGSGRQIRPRAPGRYSSVCGSTVGSALLRLSRIGSDSLPMSWWTLMFSRNGAHAPGVGVAAGVWHQGLVTPGPAAVPAPGTMVRSQSESLVGSVTGVPSGLMYVEPGASTVSVPNRPWLTRARLLGPGCT